MGKSILLIFIGLCLTSCSKTNDTHKETSIRINLNSELQSFDPRCVRTIKDVTVVKNLYEGLIREYNDSIDNISMGVAKKIDLSEDKLTYTFFLRDCTWSNGDALTSYDFKESWEQLISPHFTSIYSYMLDTIKNAKEIKKGTLSPETIGIKAIDPQTLVVSLEAPNALFLKLLSCHPFFPVHKSVRNKESKSYISNGPFVIASWEEDSKILLKKNANYWQSDIINIDNICFSMIKDQNTELLMFENGELDLIGQPWSTSIQSEAKQKLKDKSFLFNYDILGTFWLSFNNNHPTLSNKKLRKALYYSIDKDSIINYVLKGCQKIAHSVVPSSMLSYSTYNECSQNAQKLLDEALNEIGITKKELKLTLYYPSSITRTMMIVQAIQDQWKNTLGLDVELLGHEYKVFLERRQNGVYEIAIGDWIADFNDPMAFLEIFKSKTLKNGESAPSHYSFWQNEEYNNVICLLEKESNLENRSLLIKQAERILLEDVPVAPIYHHAFEYAIKKNCVDILTSPLGCVFFNTERPIPS